MKWNLCLGPLNEWNHRAAHAMLRIGCGVLQEKHADAIDRMYEVAGLKLKTATEAERASHYVR
jgi:hypothetical protein